MKPLHRLAPGNSDWDKYRNPVSGKLHELLITCHAMTRVACSDADGQGQGALRGTENVFSAFSGFVVCAKLASPCPNEKMKTSPSPMRFTPRLPPSRTAHIHPFVQIIPRSKGPSHDVRRPVANN